MSDVTPGHVDKLMRTDRIVLKLYRGKRRLQVIDFSPTTFREYLAELNRAAGSNHLTKEHTDDHI